MKNTFIAICLLFNISLFGQTADKSIEVSKTVLQLIQTNKASEATAYFDETMKKQLPAETIKNIWENLTKQLGGFVSTGEITSEKFNEYNIVYIVCHFKTDKLKYKAVINTKNQVSGLFFIPVDKK